MKKSILLSVFLIFTFFFFSCKKDSDSKNSSTYYIKATIGGTEKTYTSNPLVTVINTGTVYSIALSAGAGGSSLEGLGFQITQNLKPITAGTYIETGTNEYTIAGDYNPGTTDVSAIFGAGFKPFTSHPLQIVISTLNDATVSGTFSGEFFSNSGNGSDSLLISNGSFNLPAH